MGTWSQPHTQEKATKLAKLMVKPILKNTACELLYDLVGDDDLFDYIEELDCDSDIRFLIQMHITKTLDNLHLSLRIWDDKAIAICQKLAH